MYSPHRIKLPFKTEKKFSQQLQQKELVVEHVRFGSLADILRCGSDVCFTPECVAKLFAALR
jgi:hypothetical protein